MPENQPIPGKGWSKTAFVTLLAVLFALFLLLNVHAVIEPRVHLIVFRYERARLPIVLLVTAIVGFVAGLCFQSVVATLHEFKATRRRVDAESLKREMAGLEAASAE